MSSWGHNKWYLLVFLGILLSFLHCRKSSIVTYFSHSNVKIALGLKCFFFIKLKWLNLKLFLFYIIPTKLNIPYFEVKISFRYHKEKKMSLNSILLFCLIFIKLCWTKYYYSDFQMNIFEFHNLTASCVLINYS